MRKTIELLAAVVLIALSCSDPAAAQIELERVFPPAAKIGGTTSAKAEGKFPIWPVQVSVDRKDIKIEPSAEKGQFQVQVDEQSHPGIAWVRLLDPMSATTLTPMLIGLSTIAVEKEPNDRLTEANSSTLPAAFVGRLEKNGDVDVFKVRLSAGQTLVASTTANRILRSPMDSVLQITDDAGNVLYQSDDARGLDPGFQFTAKKDGDYFLRIFAFPETPNSTIGFAGGSSFVYHIEATVGPFLQCALPISFNDAQSKPAHQLIGCNLAQGETLRSFVDRENGVATLFASNSLGWQLAPIVDSGVSVLTENDLRTSGTESSAAPAIASVPALLNGVISESKEVDRFDFNVRKGIKYQVLVRSRALAFQVDPTITVSTHDGKQIASNDDASRNDYDSTLTFTATEDGPVRLSIRDVTDAYSPSHVYTATVKEVEPDFALTIDADHFIVAAGSTVDVPVTVTRLEGMSGDIHISATDLPSGITATPVDSLGKGDSSKKVVLKFDAKDATALHGIFRVVGIAKDDSTVARPKLTRVASLQLRESYSLTKFWLTVTGKQ